VPFALAGEA